MYAVSPVMPTALSAAVAGKPSGTRRNCVASIARCSVQPSGPLTVAPSGRSFDRDSTTTPAPSPGIRPPISVGFA